MSSFVIELVKLPFRAATFAVALLLALPLWLHYVLIPVYAMLVLALFLWLRG